jgi:hypothetical protein
VERQPNLITHSSIRPLILLQPHYVTFMPSKVKRAINDFVIPSAFFLARGICFSSGEQ